MSDFVNDVVLYTDGGCSDNPGVGAWAFVACGGTDTEVLFSDSGGDEQTTNNRMELFAAIAALQWLHQHDEGVEHVVLYTDSQYLKKGMNEWLAQWVRRGWKLSSGSCVRNKDLWQELRHYQNECKKKNVNLSLEWVKGHAGNTYNEMCHNLVTKKIAELKGGMV